MKTDKKKYAVIVAGGTGSRLGGGLPKQFRDLNGKPVIWWSMKAFKDADPDTEIILVLHADYVGTWNDLYSSLPEDARIAHHVVRGGATRTESVVNGIARIEDSEDVLIAVHDAARPLVSSA
ncbi:MAG: 2-C-methyl-D-erythritol 4-phosphate cytidylyltransferase, partial [Muribaculaceae bacterium]|nr:2-C-methyl-D-erythritol 4-phosphate cytidylyltransferase [Muribaculaceae bacterium]